MAFNRNVAKGGLLLFSLLLAVGFLVPGSLAQIYGPRLKIQEEVTGAYYYDGSVKTAAARTGQFFGSVPNDDDVLQYIRITLGSPGWYKYTNIQDSTGAYHDVLTSQPSGDWEQLYVNTTSDVSDTGYVINDTDQAPTLNLSMTYVNERGGQDLYDVNNIDDPDNNITVVFSITNPSTNRAINGARAMIYLRLDTGAGGTAEPHVMGTIDDTGSTSTPGDRDSDGYYDQILWTGIDIPATQTRTMTAYINITNGVHILTDSYLMTPQFGEDGMNASWGTTSELFSTMEVADKFARGPVRQGVDMSSNAGYWYIRGFFRNMGSSDEYNLTYNVSSWSIYSVDPSTGQPYPSANQTGEFDKTGTADQFTPGDGRIYTTNDSRSSNTSMYNSSSTTKPYIAVSFDWEVMWNETNNELNVSYINTTMDLTTLYLVDFTGTKGASGTVSPDQGGENVTINDTLANFGHDNTDPGFVQILSYIPNNTTVATGNNFRGSGWLIQNDVRIWMNDSYLLVDDADNCVLTITQPTESSEGLVNLTIYDLAGTSIQGGGTVGGILDEDQEIVLSYRITSDVAMTTGDGYTLWGIGQLNSSTYTIDREYFNNQSVSVSGKRLTGYKDLIAYNVNIPTLINTTINISVQDSAGTGISGIKFIDYVPNAISYGEFVGNFSNGDWVVKLNGAVQAFNTNYQIHDTGIVTLPDGLMVHAFEFVNRTGGTNSTWTLQDGDYIEVSYQINYSAPGTYLLPTTIAAFDPDTGASLETSLYGVIKISIPEPNLPMTIDEGELAQSKTVLVGKPAVWTKEFDVFNPNPRKVSAVFEARVFDDASDGYVTFFNEDGRKVEEQVTFAMRGKQKVMTWSSVVNPFENRNYEVVVLTPPILEIDRDVEVLEQLPNKKVRLKMDVFLKSFAKEEYRNVILNLPISYENIEEVRDGFGNRLAFTGGPEAATITVDRMGPEELKTISVIYQESYPTIIITPDRDRYNLNSPVNLEILVINGGEKIDYPFLEIEIYTPGMDVVFSDVQKLEEMDPLEKTETYQKFVIPASAPDGMYIASAKFREDFAILASTTGNFYVVGVSGGLPAALETVMIIMVLAVLGFFSWRRLKEVRGRGPNKYGGI